MWRSRFGLRGKHSQDEPELVLQGTHAKNTKNDEAWNVCQSFFSAHVVSSFAPKRQSNIAHPWKRSGAALPKYKDLKEPGKFFLI